MKSKPQSTIHFKSSSDVACLEEGLGELKSTRLNPRQRGNGLTVTPLVSAMRDAPATSTVAADRIAVLMKRRRLSEAFISSIRGSELIVVALGFSRFIDLHLVIGDFLIEPRQLRFSS